MIKENIKVMCSENKYIFDR